MKKAPKKEISRLTMNCPIHIKEELDRRRGAHMTATSQTFYDLETYWSVLKIGFKSAITKITQDQARLILDVQNGTMIDPNSIWAWVSTPNGLHHQVQDGIELDGLGEKWGIDKDPMLIAISSLTDIELLAIIDWAKTFWNGKVLDIDEAVKNFLA